MECFRPASAVPRKSCRDCKLLALGFALVYLPGFWAFNAGQTPGKVVMGIQIVTADGSPPGITRAIARWLGYAISSIFGLGFLWIIFDQRKQGIHDKIAGTYVVRKGTATGMATSLPAPAGGLGSPVKMLIVVAGVILVLSIVVIGGLALLGPQIGSVFSSITSGLAGP